MTGIRRLSGTGARRKRIAALLVILVPLAGAIEAARLLACGGTHRADPWLFAAMYFVHMAGVTMGFHRLFAHRSFAAGPGLRALLGIAASTAAQGPLLDWVATHRRHHAYSDADGDPHSPNLGGGGLRARLGGLWRAHVGWMLDAEATSWSHFAPDLVRDRGVVWLHCTYAWWLLLGLLAPAAVGGALDGAPGAWSGLVFGGLARIFVANQMSWAVGSISHVWGTRPYATGDRSANNWPVAIFTFGEGLQNNHHAFPGSYRHGLRWWEPDVSGWILALLHRLGAVRDARFPSEHKIARLRRS